MKRIYVFLGLFSLVYFFEAIGGSYIVSAVQNIERQFQIPSKLSGFMISANDIGYIPAVIFISYFGSKGNRARWIGAGTVMIALTYIAIASPNFLFPVIAPHVNTTYIQTELLPTAAQLLPNATLAVLLQYPVIKDRMPVQMIHELLQKDAGEHVAVATPTVEATTFSTMTKDDAYSTYSIEGQLLEEAITHAQRVIDGTESTETLTSLLRSFVQKRNNSSSDDIAQVRKAAIAPFTFCGRIVNDLRMRLNDVKCMHQTSNLGPFAVLFGALFFLGIGRTMPWSLGVPLLDDNVKSKNSPAYFAAISFIRVLGPICGFIIGSICNRFYYTLKAPDGLSPADPTWIGAWWIGFVVIGTITFFPSLALFCFPNSKSSSGDANEKGGKQLNFVDKHKKAKDADDERSSVERIKGFFKEYREVLKTKIYRGSVIGRICDILAFKGYMTFLPKYLENHFGIPQYKVHRYMAMFGVFGFALGTVTGGLFVRRFKLTGRQAALMVLIISTLNTAIFFSKSFMSCESTVSKVGIANRETNFNFTRECNADCGCDGARLFPVCDKNGAVFFSPCHAGCRDAKVNRYNAYDVEFSSCECAAGGIVRKDLCHDNCTFPTGLFFTTVLIGAFIGGTGVVPGLLILLRSVPPATRSVSLGLQGFLVSLFGTLPSPLLWGTVIDTACLVWDTTCSGAHGACAIYDSAELRTRMHFMYTAIRIVSLFTDFYVWTHAKDLKIMEEEEKDEEIVEAVRTGSIRLRDLKEQ